ncbi:MAG: metallophosphoesterase, partial [Deltaproteobacteria bacterium]|nr:metallophosphoesterase [Deltaproteobacteria bacterium]
MVGVTTRRSGGHNALLLCFVAMAMLLGSGRATRADEREAGAASALLEFEVWVKQAQAEQWTPAKQSADAFLVPTDRPVQLRPKAGLAGGELRSHSWDFGDPHNRSGMAIYKERPVHRYTVEGRYSVVLRAWDGAGNLHTAQAILLASSLDDTPPQVPRGLGATAVSPTQIDLHWAAGADDVAVTKHRIFRDGAVVGESSERRFADTGLSPGTSHRYRLTALDAKGNESTACAELTATTLPAGGFAPLLQGRAVSDQRILLQWSPSKDEYSAGGYAIQRDDLEVGRSPVPFFSDEPLSASTLHRYSVRAVDDTGNPSQPSQAIPVETLAAGEALAFTLAVLPDTQIYTQYHPEIFRSQTRWIRDNRVARNIVFALHEGDITNTNSESEWANAGSALALLDGLVPYALATGNHDDPSLVGRTRDLARFNAHFPAERLSATPSFGDAFESGKMDNVYHLFSEGGASFMVLVLEYEPRTRVLEWANRVVSNHPRHNVILLTHAYLNHDGRRLGEPLRTGQTPVARTGDARNEGQAIWDDLVRRHPNFLLVLSGHVLGDGTAFLES